mmetsp:Transcript_6341/g.15189  ORF Transcript_6341/g.15189 Transcript_6341/m.15189 type:complete len:156 (-) Transcript_6341:84-551(-)
MLRHLQGQACHAQAPSSSSCSGTNKHKPAMLRHHQAGHAQAPTVRLASVRQLLITHESISDLVRVLAYPLSHRNLPKKTGQHIHPALTNQLMRKPKEPLPVKLSSISLPLYLTHTVPPFMRSLDTQLDRSWYPVPLHGILPWCLSLPSWGTVAAT